MACARLHVRHYKIYKSCIPYTVLTKQLIFIEVVGRGATLAELGMILGRLKKLIARFGA
jgi:hypothetical protein